MGFYMEDANKLKVYIDDAYLKAALLDTKKPSVKIIPDTSSQLALFKKLNVKIPVIGPNDLTTLLDDDTTPETLDTNSSFLFLRKEPLMAYLYLLKEGRAYEGMKRDILYGSAFNSRADSLLSFLSKREESGLDIFSPLRGQLRRYSNYHNPFEKDSKAKEAVLGQSSSVIEPGFLTINYGNIFYAKNGNPPQNVRALFSKVLFTEGEKPIIRNYPLPTTPEMIGILYAGGRLSEIVDANKLSYPEIAGQVLLRYAFLAMVYSAAIILGIAGPAMLALLGKHVGIADAVAGAGLIGLSRLIASNNIFENFRAIRKVARTDWIKTDAIFDLVSRKASFAFDNRLKEAESEYTIDSQMVSSSLATSFGFRLTSTADGDTFDIYNSKASPDPAVNGEHLNYSWYARTIKHLTGLYSNYSQMSSYPFSTPESPIFTEEEYAMMKKPLTPFIETGNRNSYLDNPRLVGLLLRTNYAYFMHSKEKDIREPGLIRDHKDSLNYILNNDMLMEKKGSKTVLVNFGTSPFQEVIEAIILSVQEGVEGFNMNVERITKSIQNVKKALQDLDYSTLTGIKPEQRPYLPLARLVLLRYLDWLEDDEKDEDDIHEIFEIDDPIVWELYCLTFFIRHTIYNLDTVIDSIDRNPTYKDLLMRDPTGGNTALGELAAYATKFRDNHYAKLYGSYLLNNIGTIYDMMAGTTTKPYLS